MAGRGYDRLKTVAALTSKDFEPTESILSCGHGGGVRNSPRLHGARIHKLSGKTFSSKRQN